jgi:acyl-CoA reductase-like NAD-dependent aldehyde dehydrogenase
LVGSAELVEKTSLAPSILVNLNSKSRIYRDESFAPSASLFVVSTDEEAIERANDTEFGLSASLFTRDYKKAIQYARELDFGQVQINGPTIYADGEFLQLVMSGGHALTFLQPTRPQQDTSLVVGEATMAQPVSTNSYSISGYR